MFTYPGAKVKLAARIVSIFPPTGYRYVDVFAGRGSLVFELMRRGGYQQFWINAVGTIAFFKELRWLGPAPAAGPLLFKNRTKKYYRQNKKDTLGASLERLIPELEQAGAAPIVELLKRGQARATEEELRQPASAATEAYVSYNGGTFNTTGRLVHYKGGVTKDGMIRKFHKGGLLLEKNWKRIKLTAIDYRDVLAQCTAHDLVYL